MKNIKINYQTFDYQQSKLDQLIANKQLKKHLNAVILGDFSCIYRLNNLLNNKSELHTTKEILNSNNIPFFLQLPLVIKEDEMILTKKIIENNINNFAGFLTGDLGLLDYLSKKRKNLNKEYDIIYISNVLNKEFTKYLKENFSISAIRPLMPKRVFIEESIEFPKDILIYGNMLLNCATFCFHSEDMINNCTFKCSQTKAFTMQKERLQLLGRSFLTEKIWDQTARISHIKDMHYATILDADLSWENITKGFNKIINEIS